MVDKLQCDDPRLVGKYTKFLESLLDEANECNMIIDPKQNISISLSEDAIVLYENLNSIITQCVLKAEKKGRKLYMGGFPFLPEVVIHLN